MKPALSVIAAIGLACPLSGTALPVPATNRTPQCDQSTTTVMPAMETLKQNEFQEEGTVGWDPISCWDCSQPDEPVALFVAGLIVFAPIMMLVMRVRTRRNDAMRVKHVLEI